MNNKSILKILIVLEIVCGLIGPIMDVSLESYLPQEFQQYIARTEDTDLTTLQIVGGGIALFLLVAQIVSWIGLWKLWKHARLLYTVCVIIDVPFYLFLEPVVYYTTVGAIFSTVTTLAIGMILGLLYFSDLKNHFLKMEPPNT